MNPRQQNTVLRYHSTNQERASGTRPSSGSVEVSKIHAYPYLPRVLLLYWDDIRNPLCIATWLYEPGLQQLIHLFLHPSDDL
jgi:hypothetical protein